MSYITKTDKTVCYSLEDVSSNVSIGATNLQIGNLKLTAKEYAAIVDSGADVSLFAQDYIITCKESESATGWSWSESAAMTAGKLSFDIENQTAANLTIVGYDEVDVDNSTIADIYAAEWLDTQDDYIANEGYAGTFSAAETMKSSSSSETDSYTFNKTATAAGEVDIENASSVGTIAGYAEVEAEGTGWKIERATAGKLTYKRTETYVDADASSETYSTKADVASTGSFEASGNGTVGEAIYFQTVELKGSGTRQVTSEDGETPQVIGNLTVEAQILGGKFNQTYSYTIKNGEEDTTETYSLVNSQAANGTFKAGYADGSNAVVQGFATVTLDAYATNFYLHTGTAKDTKKGSQTNGSVMEMPNTVTVERYATGTATVNALASAEELSGFDKVTVNGTATTVNYDDIQNFMSEDAMFEEGTLEDMTTLIGDIDSGLIPDSEAVSGKLTITNSIDKDGNLNQTTTAYTAKKGGTLTVNATGIVGDAYGYGTVNVNGGTVTGTLSQAMTDKWTFVKTYTYEPDYDENGGFTSMESSAKGKLTVSSGTLGDVVGYSTIKIDGTIDKKTKQVTAFSTVNGSIKADSYKYAYNTKSGEETQSAKAAGSATISNTLLKGDIISIDKVTLTNVTWKDEADADSCAGSIYGGSRTASVNGKKGNSDVFDLLGTAKITSSDVSGIYGMKTITLLQSSASEILTDNAYLDEYWTYEDVEMTNSAKMAGTITLTDSDVKGEINGYATLTVKNTAASKTSAVAGSTYIGAYVGTDGADKVSFANGTVVVGQLSEDSRAVVTADTPSVVDFMGGKNTLTIAKSTSVTINCDVTFGDGDDTLSHSGSSLTLQALSMGEGKNTVDIKKGSTLILNGAIDLGSNKASTMKIAGEVFLKSQDAMDSLANSTQLKVDKAAIFATTTDIWDNAESTVIGSAKVYDIGDDDDALAYSGYTNETADNAYKKALLADSYIGQDGWLSQDDGSGRYLTDAVDFYKLGSQKVTFQGENLVTTYYDAKGKVTTTESAATYVSVGMASGTTGVARYSILANA